MVEYVENGDLAIFQGVSFRKDKRTGYFLSSRLIEGKRKRLHVVVWEHYNGSIPDSFQVHHKEGNKNKNNIEDLELLQKSRHMTLHAQNWSEERKERSRKNLIEKAQPKAVEWHRSKEGRAWHKKQGKASWENRQPVSYCCTQCRESFESLKVYSKESNTFCSSLCKVAFRRQLGLDNEIRKCVFCDKEFTINKYSKQSCCSKVCGSNWRKARGTS